MIKFINGSLEDSKQGLNIKIKEKKNELARFKKENTSKERTQEDINKIGKFESWLNRFKVSVMSPVKIESIVINHKPYEQLLKKLKRFQVTESTAEKKLIISYVDIIDGSKGSMELYDISDQFTDVLDKLPEAKIVE